MLFCRYGSAWYVLPSAPPHWTVLSRTLSFKHKEKTNETIFSCKHVFFFLNILKTGLKRVNILLKCKLETGQKIIIWKCWKQTLTTATDNRSAYWCVFNFSFLKKKKQTTLFWCSFYSLLLYSLIFVLSVLEYSTREAYKLNCQSLSRVLKYLLFPKRPEKKGFRSINR